MGSRVCSFLLLLLLLGGAAGIILVVEDRRARESPAFAESFQNLVGGLGFGPALDLSDCASDFDPRLEGCCAMDYGPIAGGACYSSRHGSAAFFYPPLKKEMQGQGQEKSDAVSP